MEHKCERPPENGNSVARSEHVFTALFTKNKLSKLLQQHLSKICRWMLFQITTIKSITNVMFWEFCIFGIFFTPILDYTLHNFSKFTKICIRTYLIANNATNFSPQIIIHTAYFELFGGGRLPRHTIFGLEKKIYQSHAK
jgi:hypothetical protein